MQRLVVYQSLWAMEQRRPDGFEWSLDQKLQMIRDAGFDGAGVRFFDRAYARQVTQRLHEWGLTWQAQCYPQRVEDLGLDLRQRPVDAGRQDGVVRRGRCGHVVRAGSRSETDEGLARAKEGGRRWAG